MIRQPRTIFGNLLLLGIGLVVVLGAAMIALIVLRPPPGDEPVNAREVAALLRGGTAAPGRDGLKLATFRATGEAADTTHGQVLARALSTRTAGSEPVIFGYFTVALKQPDGSWRTVSHIPDAPFERWKTATVLWIILALLLVVPAVWLFSLRIARPVRSLAKGADRLGRELQPVALDVEGPREIRQAATAINALQMRLQRYVRERTSVIGAIAHDLRTPLARLQFHLNLAPADVRERAEAEIADMERMIASALDFVQNEARSQPHELLDLSLLVEGIVNDQQDLGRPVRLRIECRATVRGDPLLLKRLFANLINNAISYGKEAAICLWLAGNRVVVDIADKGPGLAADDLSRAFEPFYRAENSRNRSTGGLGLGLAIVQAAARAHGGTVELVNLEQGGLCASVTLPLSDE